MYRRTRVVGLLVAMFLALGFSASVVLTDRVVAADKGKVVVMIGGGDLADANMKAYVEPFEKETGIKVIPVREWLSLAKLKLMVESGKVELDVADQPWGHYLTSAKARYLEKIDYSIYSPSDLAALDDWMKAPYGIASYSGSYILAYDTEKFPLGKPRPTSWAEFWDVKKFPGPRTLREGVYGSGPYEEALLADGVPMDKLYPLDIDRAFRTLNKIRPYITKWWREGAGGQQLFADRVVAIGQVFNGRIGTLQKKGLPLAIEWNQGKLQWDFWVIPKGAPNRENAQKFVEFATRARQQALYTQFIPYGPANKRAFDYIKPEIAEQLPTYPPNLKKQFVRNEAWYAEAGPEGKSNLEVLIDRWNKWILE